MNPRLRHVLTAAVVIALTNGARPQGSASGSPVLSGPVRGAWEPPASQPTGFLAGSLLSVDGSLDLFAFQATLIAVSGPCLACVEGEIVGTLDDGVGPGPDFLVRGRFLGIHVVGMGSYDARIFRPGSTAPVGSIRGRFGDPMPGPGPGVFAGRFRLQR